MNPILGMTKRPYGQEFQAPAFLGCVSWAASEDECVRRFKAARPDLTICPPARSALDRMIDDACKTNEGVAPAFMDWVAENIWGLEGDPATAEIHDYAEVMREIEQIEDAK